MKSIASRKVQHSASCSVAREWALANYSSLPGPAQLVQAVERDSPSPPQNVSGGEEEIKNRRLCRTWVELCAHRHILDQLGKLGNRAAQQWWAKTARGS